MFRHSELNACSSTAIRKTTPMLTDALIEKMVADADTMARKFVGVPVAPQSMIRKLTQAQTRLDRSDGRITL
jgi:hypothetical protein